MSEAIDTALAPNAPRQGRRATKIQWTQRTWPVTSGCREWSPGCLNCYATRDARRLGGNPNAKVRARYAGLVVLQNNHLRWTGEVRELPEQLRAPLTWRAPTTVFVNSLSDLFQEGVSFEFIAAVFGVMAMCARHTFQVLTKRPDRMRRWFEWVAARAAESGLTAQAVCVVEARALGVAESSRDCADAWPLPNVWVGTSVEDQKRANERVPELLACPAVVRFLSCEPLLEGVDLARWLPAVDICATCGHQQQRLDGDACARCEDESDAAGFTLAELHWVITGGESGPGARHCNVAWLRTIVQQCQRAFVPVFVKQLGARPICSDCGSSGFQNGDLNSRLFCEACNATSQWHMKDRKGGDPAEWPKDLRVREMPQGVLP